MLKKLKTFNSIYIFIIGIILVVILSFLDIITNAEYSFAIFYLIPIFFVTWFSNKRYGLIISIICSLSWLNADMQAAGRYINAAAPYWNAAARFGLFLTVVILLGRIKKMEETLENKVIEKTKDLINEISERIKTENELQLKTEKLSELAQKLQTIKEEENIKIAREIHDELGQSLTAIKIDLAWLGKKHLNNSDITENLFKISHSVDETIKIVREISSSLRPKLLDELGFNAAVERYLKDFENRTGIYYNLKFPGKKYTLTNDQTNALFRIFQEALTNIARHSGATSVDVHLNKDSGNWLNMIIRDNGIGLPQDYEYKKDSLGLIGMKERAHNIGGVIEISSNGKRGTEINVKIKLLTNGI